MCLYLLPDSNATSKGQLWPLQPPPAAAETRFSSSSSSSSSIISEAHWVFGRLGFSGFWVWVKECPLIFISLTISMPTVESPLYFRCVLNSLCFWFRAFWLLKRENQKVATSATELIYIERKQQDANFHHSCHPWAPSVFGCNPNGKEVTRWPPSIYVISISDSIVSS